MESNLTLIRERIDTNKTKAKEYQTRIDSGEVLPENELNELETLVRSVVEDEAAEKTILAGERVKSLFNKNITRNDNQHTGQHVRVTRKATKADEDRAAAAFMLGGQTASMVREDMKRSAELCGVDWKGETYDIVRSTSDPNASDVSGQGSDFLNGTIFQTFLEAEKSTFDFGKYCDVYNTPVKHDTHVVTNDDTDITSGMSYGDAQLSTITPKNFVFTKHNVQPKELKTATEPVSLEMLRDVPGFASTVLAALGRRLGRSKSYLITTQSTGIPAKASASDTDAFSFNITIENIDETLAQIDSYYHPDLLIMCNQSTWYNMLGTVVDGEGHRLLGQAPWGNAGVEVDKQIRSHTVMINNYMDSMSHGVSKKPIVFFVPQHLRIQNVGNPQVWRDNSIDVKKYGVGFYAWDCFGFNYTNPLASGNTALYIPTGALSGD